MGTKVHCRSYLPGYYSMRDLNEDSNSSSWPLFYGDKTLTNGQCYNLFVPRTVTDGYLGYDKDALKQKMLEHEAIFKNQVYELHRLYRTQRDMMEEIKKNELHKHQANMEPSSSSSSLHGSQMPSEDARKRKMTGFPLLNSGYGRTSVLGVEIVTSPSSCTNGNNKHTGHFPFHHGCSSKDTEALDLRPSKVRKKLFDLQLPADQYIDTEDGERIQEGKECGILSYTPNGVQKVAPDSGRKFFLGGDASASSSCLRRSIGLADLNEPIPVEEVMAPSSVDFLDRTSNVGETKGVDQSAEPSAGIVRVLGETIHSHNRSSMNSSIETEVKEREWLTHIYEAGTSKSNPTSAPQGLQKEKLPIPSQTAEVMLNQVCHPPGIRPTGHSREDPSRDRSCDHSNNNHSESVVASQIPGLCPFPGFANLWSHSLSSSANPTSCFTQKITPLPTPINSVSTSQETFGDKWKVNASSRLNPSLGSDVTSRNGFYHGPVLGFKEQRGHLPSDAIDYFNCSKGDNVASDHSPNHGYGMFLKGSTHVDRKPAVDIDLNEVVLKSSSNAAICLQDLNKMDGRSKPEDVSTWPWLKLKPSYKNEAAGIRSSELSGGLGYLQAYSTPPCCKSERVRDLNQTLPPTLMSASSDCEIVPIHETRNIKKILGSPICEIPSVDKNEPSSCLSTSGICTTEGKISKNERQNGIIDINLACESDEQIAEELIIEKEIHTKGTCTRNLIDLNSCISDDEDPPAPSVPSNSAIAKISVEIDLEAPVILESEDDNGPSKENMQVEAFLVSSEHKAEQIQDEIVRNAAQTIIAISSSSQQILAEDNIFCPPEASLEESLLWFVDVISSCADKLESKESGHRDGAPIRDLYEEIDDFEARALQLTEMKEEDYMPKPLVPEVQNVEEIVPDSLPNRSRRGPRRRGRQRRDFQRDILPGMASLSRNEARKDLQTFGGLIELPGVLGILD
ncbi:Plant protein of unknown function (DUF863) [Abeliophyllum distichum]|uniref:Uncharacterized protein n=1 Tax=Abeliophyllum distichum TaxID=126358 RepID=A0ABD1R993_9LAMI